MSVESLFELVNPELMGLVALGIMALIWFVGSTPVSEGRDGKPRNLRDIKIWRRIVPMLPIALGVLIYVGAPLDIEGSWGVRALQGLAVGMFAPQIRKIIKRGIFDKLKERKDD